MGEKGLAGSYATGCLVALTLAGGLLWVTLSGYLGEARLYGAACIAAVMFLLYFALRHMERALALRMVGRNWELAGEKVELTESLARLEETYTSTLQAIAVAIDANDTYADGHSTRVAGFAVKIGKAMGLGEEELQSLEKGALFHDIGKVWVPDYILMKEGPLTAEEQAMIRKHPVMGADMLDSAKSLRSFAPAVLHHHERFDGTGYPYGLKGLAIPLEARILAVADAFDAMTSERPYRSALLMREALEELYSNAGGQFDPRVIEAFLNVLDDITQEPDIVNLPDKHFGARLYSTVGNC